MKSRLLIASLSAVLLLNQPCATADNHAEFDVLIVDGQVYDGTGNPPTVTSIGIKGDRIVIVNDVIAASAETVIDASGLAIMPGFIDPHTHAADELLNPELADNINYLTQGVTTVVIGNDGRGLEEREKAITAMTEHGIGTHTAFFAGHGTVRLEVMGMEDRAPAEDELELMKVLVAEEMEAGALGLSTGLFYAPGSYSETDEVVELAKVAAAYGGIYDSHIRDEASYNLGVLGAVAEAIEIGRQADIPVHLAHLKALGQTVWGQSEGIVEQVNKARAEGLIVTADQYPWEASGTRLGSALVPRWVMADSREAMLTRLSNPDLRERIALEIAANLVRRGGPEKLLISGDSQWRGKTLAEISTELELPPIEAAIEVVKSGDPSVASFVMQWSDISTIATEPWVMTGSDGSSGHPRKYASYPKGYRDMVVRDGMFTVSEYVHRSTGLPADTLGLCDRGYIEAGRRADIAIINLDEFRPMATYVVPDRLSVGVEYLLVSGQLAISEGDATGVRAGEVIRRHSQSCEVVTARQ